LLYDPTIVFLLYFHFPRGSMLLIWNWTCIVYIYWKRGDRRNLLFGKTMAEKNFTHGYKDSHKLRDQTQDAANTFEQQNQRWLKWLARTHMAMQQRWQAYIRVCTWKPCPVKHIKEQDRGRQRKYGQSILYAEDDHMVLRAAVSQYQTTGREWQWVTLLNIDSSEESWRRYLRLKQLEDDTLTWSLCCFSYLLWNWFYCNYLLGTLSCDKMLYCYIHLAPTVVCLSHVLFPHVVCLW